MTRPIQLSFKKKSLNTSIIYESGMTATIVDLGLILSIALKCLASGIILAHNHPSGNLKPSKADEELTQKIKSAAAYHDIKVLDHLILSLDGYFSFAEEGVL